MASKEAAKGGEKNKRRARKMADVALMNVIREGWWDCSYGTIQRGLPQLSEAQLESYLEQFIQQEEWSAVSEILASSAVKPEKRWTDRLESCFEKLVAQDKWQLVGKLLETVAVGESSRRLIDRLESCFKNLIAQDKWQLVGTFLQTFAVADSACRWTDRLESYFEGLVTRDDSELSDSPLRLALEGVLPYLPRHLRDIVLTIFMRRDKWQFASNVLATGVSETARRHAVEEASKRANDWEFKTYILPCFSKTMLNLVLTNFVSRHMWWSVGEVLQISNPNCTWVGLVLESDYYEYYKGYHDYDDLSDSSYDDLDSACAVQRKQKSVSDSDIVTRLIPYIPQDQLELVLTILVEQGKFKFVSSILSRGVSESMYTWACEEAVERLDEVTKCKKLLGHFSNDQRERLLTKLVHECNWYSVETVLERGVTESACNWAVREASKKAGDCYFCHCILHYCKADHLDRVLTTLVRRGLWKSVQTLLEKDVSDSQRRWAVEEASKRLHVRDFASLFLNFCSEYQLVAVFPKLVNETLWLNVKNILAKDICGLNRKWAVEEASKTASDQDFFVHILPFYENILPYCKADHLDRVLTTLVRRGLWKSVQKLLEKDVSDSQRRWAVEEASKGLPVRDFASRFLTFCSEDQLIAVFPKLVKVGLWLDVENIFAKDISGSNRKRAVEEACKIASNQDFFNHILPFCSEDEMDTVLVHQKSTVILISRCWYPRNMVQSTFVAFVLYNIGTGNNPLQLNCGFSDGDTVQYSVLQIAVCNKYCPQRMVAECIRLGLSTHQPQLTDHRNNVREMNDTRFWYKRFPSCTIMFSAERDFPSICESPFLSALLLGLPLVSTMLYESGSCSYAELFALYTFFLEEFETLLETVKQANDRQSMLFNVGSKNKPLDTFNRELEVFLPYLKDMATTPRSLMSTCRLVISHSLNIRGNRHRHVQQLPLNDQMRNYVMFSDLTHPEYSPYD